jgi:protoporphyrinogen oxidase
MKVAIIGAGLSGLSAGYELSKKGIDVAIFESKGVEGLASSYYVYTCKNNYWDSL